MGIQTKEAEVRAVLEGVAAVSARIAEIQQLMGSGPPVTSGRTFATVLAATQGATPAPSAVDGTGAPAGLEGYANGRIPENALIQLGEGRHRLWGPAAAAYRDMAATAAASGVNINVTDSYRTFDAQADVARRKGLYSQGGLAALPGTSTHGWGLSVDVDPTPAALGWLRRYGGDFGFVEDVAREPWHWTYRGAGLRR